MGERSQSSRNSQSETTTLDFIVDKARVRLVRGDITEQIADAIVNAAQSSLMGGGGVDGAIHRKGGPGILEECKMIRRQQWPDGLPTGRAVLTRAGNLQSKFVIHTVGPVWRGGRHSEQKLLSEAYRNSLSLAVASGVKRIAFPSISTGAYKYPIERAARVALETIRGFLERDDVLTEVIVVLFSKSDFQIYAKMAGVLLGRSS